MKHAMILSIFFVFSSIGFSATIHVPGDYPTIQGAIDAAVNADIVMVDPGTYVENINFKGKAITVISTDYPKVTVIDGNQAGSGVRFDSGEGLDSVLEGFTIKNGSGTIGLGGQYYGGGIFCKGSSPTVKNNIIHGNKAYSGGGIYSYSYSSPTILNNRIYGNGDL